jgi:hypothetical protein
LHWEGFRVSFHFWPFISPRHLSLVKSLLQTSKD